MELDRPVRKQKPISLTPLVDVIFLLLLFFMLSSTFTTFGQVEIGAPVGGGGTGNIPKILLVLEEDRARLNGTELNEKALLEALETQISQGNDHLLLLVRGATTTQQLVSLMTRLKAVRDLKLTVARN